MNNSSNQLSTGTRWTWWRAVKSKILTLLFVRTVSEENLEKNPDIIPQGECVSGPFPRSVNERCLTTASPNAGNDTLAHRQFQWVNANGYPVMYTTSVDAPVPATDGDLRHVCNRIPFGGVPENVACYTQFLQQQHQQQQGTTETVSSPSYMTAVPATLMPVNNVNFTTLTRTTTLGNSKTTSFTSLGAASTKMPYTAATLGRPALNKSTEPYTCAQVSGG